MQFLRKAFAVENIWIIGVIAILTIGALIVVVGSRSVINATRRCEDVGGVYFYTRDSSFCLKKDTIIR